MTGLGGEAILQSLVLAVFPLEYIHLADPGIFYPAIGVMLFSGWHRRLTAPARALLAMLLDELHKAGPLDGLLVAPHGSDPLFSVL